MHYKVLDQDYRRSIWAATAAIKYPIDTWVQSKIKGSPLFVFVTEADALVWIEFANFDIQASAMIVPCHVRKIWPPEKYSRILSVRSSTAFQAFSDYWINPHRRSRDTCPPPTGTVLVDRVRCLA